MKDVMSDEKNAWEEDSYFYVVGKAHIKEFIAAWHLIKQRLILSSF